MSSLIQKSDFSPEIPDLYTKVLVQHDAAYFSRTDPPFRPLSRKEWDLVVGWVGGLLEYATTYVCTTGWLHRSFQADQMPHESSIAWAQAKTALSRQHLIELQLHGITGLAGLCLALLKCMPRIGIDGHYKTIDQKDEIKTTKVFLGELVGFLSHASWEQRTIGEIPQIQRDKALDVLNWANEMRPAIIAALRREALLQGAKDVA